MCLDNLAHLRNPWGFVWSLHDVFVTCPHTVSLPRSQVVSALRLKHGLRAEVCPLTGCDYIVSNRMAVERRSASGEAGNELPGAP